MSAAGDLMRSLDRTALLYTDSIAGVQTCRDDLWVIDSATVAAVRAYVAAIETKCDPSGLVREHEQLKDVVRELEASNRLLRDQLDDARRQIGVIDGWPPQISLAEAAARCWCTTCTPMNIHMRMALCPNCGNKRCPRATNHESTCSHSNQLGQTQ